MNDFLKKLKVNKICSLVTFSIITLYLGYFVIVRTELKTSGDGLEYVLMAESLYNHGTPDLRLKDLTQFKKETKKYNFWENQPKHEIYEELIEVEKKIDQKKKMEQAYGFTLSDNKKFYSIHFFTYSLAVVPVKFILQPFNLHPEKVMYIANIVFVLIVIFILLFVSPLKEMQNISITFLFLLSSLHYYISWPHPEVFVACLVFLGLLFYYFDKKYLGILLCSVGATQFQPLSLFILLLVLFTAYSNKFKMNVLFKLFLSSFWVVLPSIFYYYNFGVTSLIKEFGYLDSKYITSNRFIGFFIDPNQGLILNYPIWFLVYILMYVYNLVHRIRTKKISLKPWDFIPFITGVIILIVSAMENWSHGQAVSNRYVTYLSPLFLMHFIVLFLELKKIKYAKIIIPFLVVSQFVVIIYFGSITGNKWSGDNHKPFAKYFLNNFPEFYNPDPHIFYQRTKPYQNIDFYHKGVAYLGEDRKFKKGIVHLDYLNEVEMGNLTLDQLKLLVENKKDQYGWVYFHQSDLIKRLGEDVTLTFLSSLRKN